MQDTLGDARDTLHSSAPNFFTFFAFDVYSDLLIRSHTNNAEATSDRSKRRKQGGKLRDAVISSQAGMGERSPVK